MNLETELLKEHSKRNTLRISKWVGNDKNRFKQLMNLFLKGEYQVTQRAAWVVSHCADAYPELPVPYISKMIDRMMEPGVHVAVKRNTVRILQFVEIPKRLLGKVANVSFDVFGSQHEPIAVRCFAMTVLANIAKREPELKNEIRLMIEQQMPWGSPGFRARSRNVLRELNNT